LTQWDSFIIQLLELKFSLLKATFILLFITHLYSTRTLTNSNITHWLAHVRLFSINSVQLISIPRLLNAVFVVFLPIYLQTTQSTYNLGNYHTNLCLQTQHLSSRHRHRRRSTDKVTYLLLIYASAKNNSMQ